MADSSRDPPTIAAPGPRPYANCAESLAFFAICRDHPFTMREWPPIRTLPWHLAPVLLLCVVMGVTGPFGTYNYMSLGARLAYFTLIGLPAWLIVNLLSAGSSRLEPFDRWSVPLRMAVVGLIAAVPGTALVVLVHSWLVRPIPWSAATEIFPQYAFLTVIISVLIGLLVDDRLRATADAERNRVAELPQAGPDFFRRIPPALGRDLLALQMEDHYLRIHTTVGSDLILLRLRDALAELDPARGRQVHRSWWVAEGAVDKPERDGARTLLVLRNGLKVPVSKSFRDAVKEAGWL